MFHNRFEDRSHSLGHQSVFPSNPSEGLPTPDDGSDPDIYAILDAADKSSKRRATIVLIDPDYVARRVFHYSLQEFHDVHSFASWKEAAELLATRPVHLLFIEQYSARACRHQIQSLDLETRPKLIIMAQHERASVETEIEDLQADGCTRKITDPIEVLTTTEIFLNKPRKARRRRSSPSPERQQTSKQR